MNFNDYRTNPDLEKNGKWFDFEDARFKIAANMNPEHKAALRKLGKKNQKAFRKEDAAAQALQERVLIEAMADGVLVDWENINSGVDAEGKEIPFPFTRENAIRLLTQCPPIRDFVAETATNFANFIQEGESAAMADLKSGSQVASPERPAPAIPGES